jgi:ATP synthase I chain
MSMGITKQLVGFVNKSNWFLLIFFTFLSLVNAPMKFTLGIFSGAVIAVAGFHLLKKTVNKAFEHPEEVAKRGRMILFSVLLKYYVRFAISGVIIYLLIAKNIVNPLGLLLGLSVVVISITLATLLELKRLIFKEAV